MQPYHKCLLLVFLILGYASASAQWHDNAWSGKTESYIPYDTAYWPVKRVRIVLHVFSRDDGSGGFANVPADRDFINKIVNYSEYFYKDTEPLKIMDKETAVPYIKDTRVRYFLDTVLFHRNTDDWDASKYMLRYYADKKDSELDLDAAHQRVDFLYDKYVARNVELTRAERDSAINVFFLDVRGSYNKGMCCDMGSKKWVYVLGTYYNYTEAHDRPNNWGPGMVMAHEIGHCFGLDHPFSYSPCGELRRHGRGETNDMMDYWPRQGKAITPCQLGIIHYNLAANTNIADAVIPDWNEYHPDETIQIASGDTVYWNGSRNVLGDIEVDGGTVWVVRGRIGLPPGAGVYVKPRAKVIIDGGALVSAAKTGKWKGVKLEKGKQFLFFGKKRQASLTILNKGYVE